MSFRILVAHGSCEYTARIPRLVFNHNWHFSQRIFIYNGVRDGGCSGDDGGMVSDLLEIHDTSFDMDMSDDEDPAAIRPVGRRSTGALGCSSWLKSSPRIHPLKF